MQSCFNILQTTEFKRVAFTVCDLYLSLKKGGEIYKLLVYREIITRRACQCSFFLDM